jgi:radical SAM superfamily enzyme YgiQ (UPF0313 family)
MQVCNVSDPDSFHRQESHPRGSRARILLTNAFGPYARDDEYGSRIRNPMECYHNQVTREQGPFSLRMFHRSYALSLIQANVQAPCTVLDYPTLDRFVQELRAKPYDVIGISGKLPNLQKVAKMCSLVREHQPDSMVVVGGHLAGVSNPAAHFDADVVVRGEGVRWFRRFLGEKVDRPVNHPCLPSAVNSRAMGIRLDYVNRKTAAAFIPSVGCPMGCTFCSTSATFGGKGNYIDFYRSGDELFDILCQLEERMKVWSFMVMDENFLLHRKRALRLLELMRRHEKSWAFYVFSSANAVNAYSMEELIGLGVSWVWIGLEGPHSGYEKLHGVDTRDMVEELQENGIRVLGSTIIGLEEHTPEKVEELIEWAVGHKTDFHQFMLYMALDGTPLYEELCRTGSIVQEPAMEKADVHGQYRFNFRHPHIPPGQETDYLDRAFRRDFEVNGPSVIRMMRTQLNGWLKYKHHAEARVRKRFALEASSFPHAYAGGLWATCRWFKTNPRVASAIAPILNDVYREFGWKARVSAPMVGRFLLASLKREARRLQNGHTYEPPTFYETAPDYVSPKPARQGILGVPE